MWRELALGRLPGAVLLVCVLAGGRLSAAAEAPLLVAPSEIRWDDAFARQQLLVSVAEQDVTHDCRYESVNPSVATVDESGYIVPVGPGQTEIVVRRGTSEAKATVTVSAFDRSRRVDFANEIVPLLSRLGCNSGGCHGKASGQNGFKLSLFGFDPEFDYDAIVLAARGRRVFPASPAESLLLEKAIGAVPHGGGQRLTQASEPYQWLYRWIEQGTPRSSPEAPTIAKLLVEPTQRVMHTGQRQQLAVTVEYSDGSRRDVTRQAQYASNLDVVAAVDERGRVCCGSRTGEAAIMVRYMGQVAVFRAQVPHGRRATRWPDSNRSITSTSWRWQSGSNWAWRLRRWLAMQRSCVAPRSISAAGCRRLKKPAPSWPIPRAPSGSN